MNLYLLIALSGLFMAGKKFFAVAYWGIPAWIFQNARVRAQWQEERLCKKTGQSAKIRYAAMFFIACLEGFPAAV